MMVSYTVLPVAPLDWQVLKVYSVVTEGVKLYQTVWSIPKESVQVVSSPESVPWGVASRCSAPPSAPDRDRPRWRWPPRSRRSPGASVRTAGAWAVRFRAVEPDGRLVAGVAAGRAPVPSMGFTVSSAMPMTRCALLLQGLPLVQGNRGVGGREGGDGEQSHEDARQQETTWEQRSLADLVRTLALMSPHFLQLHRAGARIPSRGRPADQGQG